MRPSCWYNGWRFAECQRPANPDTNNVADRRASEEHQGRADGEKAQRRGRSPPSCFTARREAVAIGLPLQRASENARAWCLPSRLISRRPTDARRREEVAGG